MATPLDYWKIEPGTAVVWATSGAATPLTETNLLTLNNLAAASGRMGAAVDLGAQWEEEMFVALWAQTGTAPTAGLTVELYMASSHDNTNWPGKVTGSDAAYPTTVAANKLQLGPPASVLVATADANTLLKQAPAIWRPAGRYVVPVVVNLLDQGFHNDGTPANHQGMVIMVPRRYEMQATA